MKKLIFHLGQIFCLLFFILMLLHYSLILKYAKEGLCIWASAVLPLLLPFIILSKFWIRYKIPELFFSQTKKLLPTHPATAISLPIFLLGLCSGFPIGAIFICHYYQNKTLTKIQAETLLPLASFVSPMFVMGYIRSQINAQGIAWFHYILSLYLPIFLYYFFTQTSAKHKKYRKNAKYIWMLSKTSSTNPTYPPNIQTSLADAVWIPSIEIICIIGIYMMIFSILSGLFMRFSLFKTPIFTFLLANLEVTTGIHLLSISKMYPLKVMYALTAAITSFGGICTMAQVQTVISATDLSLKLYIKIKLLSAALTFLLCMVFL